MEIIIIGTAHPFRGGLASFNERLSKEFTKQGHHTQIETFTLQYPEILFPGKSQYSDSPKPKDIQINRSINSMNPLNWIKAGRKIRKKKPDLVIFKFWLPFMGPCFGTISRIIKTNKKSTVITILDNLIPHEKRPGDRLFTKYFINTSDGFIAMSDSVFDDIKKITVKKPSVLSPHPIFDNFGHKISKKEALENIKLPNNVKYILFFGFIRDYKGLDLLIKALADERFRELDVKLIVAGEFYSDEKKYIDLIESNNLSEDIILRTNFIANEDVASYFCACDIVAQPYKTATQSGVTQIGFHFEKPMLVTNVGGLSEIIKDKEFGYVTEPDEKEIANALINFFTSDLMNTFEKRLITEKKKYSWDKMYNKIMDVYNKISNDNKK